MVWSLFTDQVIDILTSPASGDAVIPFDGLVGESLVIWASNPLAKPNWNLACRLMFERSIPDFPQGGITASYQGRSISMGDYVIIDVPLSLQPPYKVVIVVPFWHSQLSIKIWEQI